MSRKNRKKRKVGLPPGSLIHIGERKLENIRVRAFTYNPETFSECEVTDLSKLAEVRRSGCVCWVNIDGLHDVMALEEIGRVFGLHPLVLEDILNTDQRPKTEEYEDYFFLVLKMINYYKDRPEFEEEQMSLVLGHDFVLSFQELEGDVFDPIRDRLRNEKSRIRSQGADYLGYTLLDAIVDSYFVILEDLGDRIEDMEEELVTDPKPETLRDLHGLKRRMILLRRSIWPLREVIAGLEKSRLDLIRSETRLFLRDVYDHTIQVIDQVETYRDILSGMLDIYLSSQSMKLNEVMKVLTIISTIFIPLTFLAGVYGMNFHYMPEIGWHYAYFGLWGVMLAVAVTMLLFFRRKKWI